MKRSLKQRVLIAVASTVLGAVGGLLAGFVSGRAITLRLVEGRLGQFALRVVADADAASTDARAVLAAMRSSPYPFCSDEEIVYLRGQIFLSEYMKDAGRIRDGKIVCSTTLGRLARTVELPRPFFSQPDGTQVYGNLAPYAIDKSKRPVGSVRQGDDYVSFGAHYQLPPGPIAERYSITVGDASGRQFTHQASAWMRTEDARLSHNGQGRLGEGLYATRCSVRYFNCVTAQISVPGALRVDRMQFLAFILLGGIFGASFGLMCSLLYRHSLSAERQLRRAIRRDKLRVIYQPIVDLTTRRIVGAEALARWSDEEGFAVGPDVFVRIAEERGFVGAITRLVVRHALQDLAPVFADSPGFRLSINVAADDLRDARFLPMLNRATERVGLAAQSLAIEITESTTARNDAAMETIRALRQKGYGVHIDDFGTGYSSLAYLHDLSVDAIKIDRAFTQAIGTGAVTVSILPQILSMAETLKLQVIVEGIETEQQANYFAALSQPVLAQGWFFGRPVTADVLHRQLLEEATMAHAFVAMVVENK
jgi:sensor c-di-GMP phosphodiesterase-like protein